MNLKDPDSMNEVIGLTLRYGVIISAAVIILGVVSLAASGNYGDVSNLLSYNPNVTPHGNYDVSFEGILAGLATLNPLSLIEVGVILLIATPVTRVVISVLLFDAEGDRKYVVITAVVLVFLLFSMLVTPYIPGFHA
ncbi:MAG TPA: DUF1634 domain-containing protein [Nitrososphaerales archaeon]|nr:DUF1634 domain-containing protein [Nitrososphaerales archaeon]